MDLAIRLELRCKAGWNETVTPNAVQTIKSRRTDAVIARRTAHFTLEERGKGSEAGITDFEANLGNGQIAFDEESLGGLDSAASQEIVRRLTKRPGEDSVEMICGQACFACGVM